MDPLIGLGGPDGLLEGPIGKGSLSCTTTVLVIARVDTVGTLFMMLLLPSNNKLSCVSHDGLCTVMKATTDD